MRTSKILSVAAVLIGSGLSLQAVTININPGSGLAGNQAALDAFNRAAGQWESIFADPITVTINANLSNLGSSSIIGQASSVLLTASYDFIRDQIVADAADEASNGVVGFLPTGAQFTAVVPTGFTLSANMLATKANLKAMGFSGLDGIFGVADATITFNSQFGFDYNNANGVGSGLMDFETVAAHEIGHALGFVSSVDQINGASGTITVNPLDLFRFGATPGNTAQFTNFSRQLTQGGSATFSDLTNQWGFSTGTFAGDGNQASHWKADDITGNFIGIMDPTLAYGTVEPITAADIRALDVIGWDLQTQTPEPGTCALIGLGLLGCAGLRRRG